MASLLSLALAGCASGAALSSLADGRTGAIRFATSSPTSGDFARGQKPSGTVVISGELVLPRQRSGRAPAVVLIHGSSGVGRNVPMWAGEFGSIGVASFIVDSF